MNRQQLLNYYSSQPSVISISSGISEPGNKHIHLNGLIGSSRAMIMAAISTRGNQSHVVILNDSDEAAYFLNDIENILGEGHAFFFPASYKKSFCIDESDNSNILMRAEVLSKLNRNSKTLVITYPEALAEKVVTRKNLELNSIAMRVKDSISISFINEFLLHHEFENVDFVQQAGEFSIRGGIVDIYSFANELPYRIEFFGDEVESIRTFDPETQLSVQVMNHVAIMPNVQKKLLEEGRASFLDFIPGDTVIWADDLSSSLGFLKMNLLEENNYLKPELKEFFDSPDFLLEKLQSKTVIEFGKRHFLKNDLEEKFSFSPQPSFNKNFSLLISNLQLNQKQNIKNIIFADSAKQIERLYAIFEDLEKKNAIENRVEFTSLLLSLHEGFIDNEGKLACYTDHQIFDRYHRFRLRKKHNRNESLTIKELSSLKPGDYVTHIDHGVGRFAGLEAIVVNGKPQEAIRLIYKDNDILYVSIHSLHRIAKYTGKEGTVPSLHKLGSASWATLKQKTKKRVKDIAKDLIQLYAKRRSAKGLHLVPIHICRTNLKQVLFMKTLLIR